jgi:hypothetical protein
MTNEGKLRYLKRQTWHDRSALKFWRKRRSLAVLEPNRQDAYWHRVSLGIALRNLRPLERALTRTRLLGLSVPAAIRFVFGPYAEQALSVASCESGLSVYARNGMYLGLFQMGDYARARYGHGWTAYEQSRAAYAYFDDSGRDWSPWACAP